MLAQEYQQLPLPGEFFAAGRLDREALPCMSTDAVLNVIEESLTDFAKRADSRAVHNEKGITNRLCKILNCQKLIYFHHEGMEDETSGSSPTVDLEAIAISATIFEARSYAKEETLMSIEAKRLPSPPPKTREREYLVGGRKSNGGMERFKLGVHGRNAAAWTLVGYVQEGDFATWQRTLNQWVDNLIGDSAPPPHWERGDKIESVRETGKTARYRSRCKRTIGGKSDHIEVNHIWVALPSPVG